MLLRKLWRTMGLYKAQFFSMIVMITLGIGVFTGANMEWVSIVENTSKFFRDTGYADYRLYAEEGFSAEEATRVAGIEGVERVSRVLTVNADVSGTEALAGDTVTLTVTTDARVTGFLLMDGTAYDPGSMDGIWLSDRYAEANGVSLGDVITLTGSGRHFTGTVRGLVKAGEYLISVADESQLMPDYTTHGFAYISPALYEATLGFAYYPFIHVISGMEKSAFSDAADAALGRTTILIAKEDSGSYALAQGEKEEGQTMGAILPVLFLLIAVLTMVTTMHRLVVKEKVQIGTLKALGFRDRRILMHYTSYALAIGLVGSLFGVALGYGIAYFLMNPNGSMGTYFDMPEWRLYLPGFCVAIIAVMVALMTLVGYLSVHRMLRGTAADALRPYVPKKIRPLLIERTRFFHRLSFGTRWNLRDVMRHKARTAMSLIGTVGAMVLIVAALGMGDTMNGFLDMYYNGATNYATRIYLSETATDAERQEIIDRYEGDTSATVSVKTEGTREEKSVSLEIYQITHDRVRFPADRDGYVTLGDDGVYLCLRVAETLGLSAGDTLTVSPYGTDESYTLRVAGTIRSASSEIIVMSAAYAARVGIGYRPDSVYTDREKTEIGDSTAIRSLQAKQAIIDSFSTFTELLDMMVMILIVGALILGVVVLYNLGTMSYAERYREMATLKVVGFRDRRIGGLLVEQNLWLGALGVLLGLPAGIGTLAYLLHAMAGEYEMRLAISARTVIVSVLLTVGMSLIVSLMVARKNRKIDMVEALKGAE